MSTKYAIHSKVITARLTKDVFTHKRGKRILVNPIPLDSTLPVIRFLPQPVYQGYVVSSSGNILPLHFFGGEFTIGA